MASTSNLTSTKTAEPSMSQKGLVKQFVYWSAVISGIAFVLTVIVRVVKLFLPN